MTVVCGNCMAPVWWSFPRPEDPCPECGHPIGRDTSLRPRPGESAEDTLARVVAAIEREEEA